MSIQQAYNSWASQYDANENKTRDLEAKALRITLENISFSTCLEIGCGTGKNTEWLMKKATEITAIDFSEEMLEKANEKIRSEKVRFIQANILADWVFATKQYNLITFSLVLEHIQQLEPVFKKAAQSLESGGFVYVGELHPYKQYNGTKARFHTEDGLQIIDCYNHNISDFAMAAKQQGLQLIDLNEFFDDDDRETIPRIVTLLFKKS